MNYKLIKIFPGSPELGYISKTKDSNVLDGHYWMGQWFNPKDYPEFWEEVVEVPEWEILSFTHSCCEPGHYTTLRSNGLYKYDKISGEGTATLKNMLSNDYINCKIHSVRRKSDREVFTIGDIVEHFRSPADKGKITKLSFTESYFLVEFEGTYEGVTPHKFFNCLSVIKHSKLPLFTTEDGVDIFKGDKYWFCRKNTFEGSNIIEHIAKEGSDCGSNGRDYYYFSTRQAAKEYIAKNKILFVTEDGVGLKLGDCFYAVNTKDASSEIYKHSLDSTANQQMAKSTNWLWFSTKEKAQEYCDRNKPVYSKQQVINILKGFDADINDFHSGGNDEYEPYIEKYK